jgi:hypothetical protein
MEASDNFSCFLKRNSASVSNYRPISIPKDIYKLFEFVIYYHISHYLSLN